MMMKWSSEDLLDILGILYGIGLVTGDLLTASWVYYGSPFDSGAIRE
jgi:hypothetical protein